MKYRFLMIAMLATVAFCAAPTWAAWHGSANQQEAVPDKKSKTPKPSKYDITLTLNQGYGGGGVGGPCAPFFADVCFSGSCTCYTYTGSASGAAGNGTFTLYESYDNNNGWSGVTGGSGCDLTFGEIEIAGSKDTEVLSFTGSDCGSSWNDVGTLAGGCLLEDTSVFAEGAFASCSGAYNYASGKNTTFNIAGTSLK